MAAVELALIMPVFALGSILMLDFGYAFHIRLKLTNAVTAASQYAFQYGRNLSADQVADFNAKVASMVGTIAGLPSAPTVTVTFNGAADGSRAGNYYCPSGSPPVWTSTGTAVAGCGGGVFSGRFISIEAHAAETTLFQSDPVLGSAIRVTDRAIVRVK
ncbi:MULTISPECIES: TadE/TadG family type IV pilus assembly protein [unclassified Aureimonas]|uniref:TadE/TadG family type IV pilus assembly protein n=1 Tax=unclassified Aureimonas TaxID=2615206 RepID=UPI00138F2259|nr:MULTISPECIES: TadE family protein [unclassified Aureimonas]